MTAPPAARWVEELARFLRREPGVSALRIDAAAHKVAVATVGQIDLQDFESRLAETIAAIEADLASRQGRAGRLLAAPGGGRPGPGPRFLRDGREALALARDGMAGDPGGNRRGRERMAAAGLPGRGLRRPGRRRRPGRIPASGRARARAPALRRSPGRRGLGRR